MDRADGVEYSACPCLCRHAGHRALHDFGTEMKPYMCITSAWIGQVKRRLTLIFGVSHAMAIFERRAVIIGQRVNACESRAWIC
jgi:hypothetical protein